MPRRRLAPRRHWGARLLLATLIGTAGAALFQPAFHAAADWSATGSLPGLGSGAIWSIAVDPQNPNLVVAGTDAGVYRSPDGGTSWKLSALTGVRVWTVGFDVRDSKNIYAGTAGQGIRTSIDGGATWTDASNGLTNRNVRAMAFSLSQIAAGTDSGVAISVDGKTWQRGGLEGVSVSALTVVANSPNVILMAGTDSGEASQPFLWTNTGNTWQANRGTGLPAAAVVLALASGPVSQAIAHRPVVVDTNQGTFRSLDTGATWSPASNLPEVGTSTLTLTTSAFSPLDPNVVYSGADAAGSSGGDMRRSLDSGITYSDLSTGLPVKSKNVVSVAVAQTTPPTLWIAVTPPGGGGLVYKMTDATAPPPPTLVPESPGATIPVVVTTPTPSPTPAPTAAPAATPSPSAGGIGGFIGTIFHWPVPLVYELIVLLLAAYGFLRWRQRAYVEGPP